MDGYNLRVYKAIPDGNTLELIKSANLPGITKFTRPVFGDGRVYIGTNTGALYCLGSPVNPPLTCNSPLDFGTTLINSTSAARTVQCKANIQTQVTNINLTGNANFKISGLPTLPISVDKDANISFQAVFAPIAPGPLSSDVRLSTTNNVAGYSVTTPVSLKGVGASFDPLLAVSPNLVSFEGVVTGQQVGGVTQSIIISNLGDGPLTIQKYEYSVISETGALITPTDTPNGPKVGPFTFENLPTSIPGNSQATVDINFDPPTSGNFAVYVRVRSNGGTKIFDVVGTAGTYPKALLEFQAADGSNTWIPYQNNTPFTFGNVFQQETKALKMRLTNSGDSSAASLSVTVSKPPFGVEGIIGAQNGVDLGEGTVLSAGESATATLFCSVPKSQVNVDAYQGTAQWTMNTGDPTLGKLFIKFLCNAVSEQEGPLRANGSAIYRYYGCYKENNPGRQLKTQLYAAPDNTNAKCITACAAQSYTYAGTQYRDECWCGNTIPSTNTSDAECNYDCAGALKENCGGNGITHDGSFISLFTNQPGRDVAGGPPKVVQSVGPYNYTGCYTEAAPHALNSKTTASDDMTAESCAAFCTGFQYFGLEYANECYCGDTITAGSVRAPEAECKMSCAGNNSEICGAGGRLNLYTRTGAISSSSASSRSLSITASSSIAATVSTSSSIIPTPTGPIAVLAAGKFNYSGCYTEGNGIRALTGRTTANATMTVEKCADFCAAYSFMGVEYGVECYCGNIINTGSAKTTPEGCSILCGGNALEYCGGQNRLNFYAAAGGASSSATATKPTSTATPTPTGPVIVQGNANFTYDACYSNPPGGQALSAQILPGSVMTVEKCLSACYQYQHVGLEYGGECWCGNTFAAGTSKATAESECSMTCSGNSTQICGAGNRLTLYTRLPAGVSVGSSAPLSVGSSVTPSALSSVRSSVTPSAASSVGSSVAPSAPSSVRSSVTPSGSIVGSSVTPLAPLSVRSSVTTSAASSVISSVTPSVSSVQSSVTPSAPSSVRSSVTPSGVSSFRSSVTPSAPSSVSSSVTPSGSSVRSSITPSAPLSVRTSVTPSAPSNVRNSVTPSTSIVQSSATPSALSSVRTSGIPAASSTLRTSVLSVASSVTPRVSSSTVPISTSKPVSSSVRSSSTAVRLVPTAGQTINSYIYLGCANETSPRALVGVFKANGTGTTTKSCQELCLQNNYGLAATENGDTCFCGNGLQSSSTLGKTFCNTPCAGNSSETCGGIDGNNNKYLSVWNSTSSTIPPTMVKQVGTYPLDNCYSDTNTTRALTGATLTSPTTMTVESCIAFCITKNFALAGLSYGKTCSCGPSLAATAKVLPLAQCNMLCTGNRREFCGAYQNLLVYKKDLTSVDANGVPKAMNQPNLATISANTTAPA